MGLRISASIGEGRFREGASIGRGGLRLFGGARVVRRGWLGGSATTGRRRKARRNSR